MCMVPPLAKAARCIDAIPSCLRSQQNLPGSENCGAEPSRGGVAYTAAAALSRLGYVSDQAPQPGTASSDAAHATRVFPADFLFGTSTATFQNEGNKAGDKYGRDSDWDALYGTKEYAYLNHSSPDWWGEDNREALADLTRLRELGLNAQRHGVEWARIEPEKGRISAGALAQYRKLFDQMRDLELTPIFTLHHFSSPKWWPGFDTRSGRRSFEDFAKRMADAFGDIRYWVTISEPSADLAAGYLMGIRPPYRKNLRALITASHNVMKAHEAIYEVLKERADNVSVGAAHQVFWVTAHDPQSIADRLATSATRSISAYLSPRLLQPCDFIGFNFFYGLEARLNLRGRFWKPEIYPHAEAMNMPKRSPLGAELVRPNDDVSDSGWPITPGLFLEALQAVYQRFKKPIIVTSNGVSDRADAMRPYYLLSHLLAITEAIARGVDVRGYFHWTAVTNREWEEGMGERVDFGLIRVDPRTGERETRPSARMFGEIASSGRLDLGHLEEYLTPEQRAKVEAFDSRLRRDRGRPSPS
jgi:beta-glucosidase